MVPGPVFPGVHFMALTSVQYSNEAGPGKWLQIDQELETRNGQTVGTSRPTGHSVLVDVRFELPYGTLIRVLTQYSGIAYSFVIQYFCSKANRSWSFLWYDFLKSLILCLFYSKIKIERSKELLDVFFSIQQVVN